jgi:predicted 3-demethylubiquinone-9 3-methyltransferase (glyoxalase superfamily)
VQLVQKITPCLWFDRQAEEAAGFYTAIFPNSRITLVTRYADTGHEVNRGLAGTVMTVAFELDGQPFTALNGGPVFRFNEAISFQINCATQEEVDHYWERLSDGGDAAAQQCGWLKDRYGVSWQVVPTILHELISDSNSERAQRVTAALLQMKKLDIAALQRAYEAPA